MDLKSVKHLTEKENKNIKSKASSIPLHYVSLG